MKETEKTWVECEHCAEVKAQSFALGKQNFSELRSADLRDVLVSHFPPAAHSLIFGSLTEWLKG